MIEIIVVRHGESTENVANALGEAYDVDDINLTGLGKTQATQTGEYLKMYDGFDEIYCSPVKRCQQTAKIIAKYIDHKPDIIYDPLLVEAGQTSHKMAGLSEKEQTVILAGNKELIMMENDIKNEKNMFKKCNLIKKFHDAVTDYLDVEPSLDQIIQNYIEFFEKIKKSNNRRVLIIGHGGTVEGMMCIATGINIHLMSQTIRIISKKEKVPKSIPNCCVMGIRLSQKLDKFELVMPPNNDHILMIN